METGEPCVVPMKSEINEGKMLSALQVSKGVKNKEPTFLAILKMEEESKEVQAPKAIQKVLEEFKDVVPAVLPKRLPPRREVDHAIELELGAKPPTFSPYRMAPLKLEELRSYLTSGMFVPLNLHMARPMMDYFVCALIIGRLTRLLSRTSIPSLASMICLINLEMQGTLPSSI